MPQVGASLRRADDPRLLTGRGRYVDDLAPARCVHVAVVRSVHAHARLTSLALEAARRSPGVVAILTGAAASPPGVTPACRSSRAAWWPTSSRPHAASPCGCPRRCRT